MKHVQMREAKARLSELVAGVEKGEPVTITRHGTPAAVVISVEDAGKLFSEQRRLGKKTLGQLLLEFPGGIELERDKTPVRDIDL